MSRSMFLNAKELCELVGYTGKVSSFSAFLRNRAIGIKPDPFWKAIYDSRIRVGRSYRYPLATINQLLVGDRVG
ncbi:MAG: hypothetical protein HQL50_01430 [Magnetococcales bacterium]|nr:hypothetical protein [Magnetococcales bacterium]